MQSELKAMRERARRAFTLIELIIVIGVIVLLVAITLTVGTIVIENSERRNAEATLTLLGTAVDAWETTRERPFTFGEQSGYQVNGAAANVFFTIDADAYRLSDFNDSLEELAPELTTEMLRVLSEAPEAKELLVRINPKRLRALGENEPDYDPDQPKQRLLDPWDGPILVVFPGREFNPINNATGDFEGFINEAANNLRNLDGTIQTDVEAVIGAARERRICFVSPGPDGFFGDVTADVDSTDYQRTLDNLYSYELDEPEAP